MTALSVACPRPVNASEPYRLTSTESVASMRFRDSSSRRNRLAAHIGPTVCELDGPMPILNKSKMLRLIVRFP